MLRTSISNTRSRDYRISVFINCPFDKPYRRLFRAIVFTVICCGFRARCALEIDDSSQVRIDKIFRIITDCRYGVHDLSRTELDSKNRLPRFNMPLELGMFLGVRHSGSAIHKDKVCLVLDKAEYRYQKFISDIAGQDIRAHAKELGTVITRTRDWLRSHSDSPLPGGKEIERQYKRFNKSLPELCRSLQAGGSQARVALGHEKDRHAGRRTGRRAIAARGRRTPGSDFARADCQGSAGASGPQTRTRLRVGDTLDAQSAPGNHRAGGC
jgi:hypothetical protein